MAQLAACASGPSITRRKDEGVVPGPESNKVAPDRSCRRDEALSSSYLLSAPPLSVGTDDNVHWRVAVCDRRRNRTGWTQRVNWCRPSGTSNPGAPDEAPVVYDSTRHHLMVIPAQYSWTRCSAGLGLRVNL